MKMYNKIVRDELESNYRETNFDPRKMLQFMDKKYRHEALMDMREDEILTKSLKKMYDENVKMSKKIDRNVRGALNDLLNDDWKLANCYRERYVNSKKKVVDPIKRQVYGPKTEVKKGIGGKK